MDLLFFPADLVKKLGEKVCTSVEINFYFIFANYQTCFISKGEKMWCIIAIKGKSI
jgi:hypothetical protein